MASKAHLQNALAPGSTAPAAHTDRFWRVGSAANSDVDPKGASVDTTAEVVLTRLGDLAGWGEVLLHDDAIALAQAKNERVPSTTQFEINLAALAGA